jgi:hypothetical protein
MPSGPGIVLLNILALCLLLLCLRYGIRRERNHTLVWTLDHGASSVGFSFINLENIISRHAYNQIVTIGGCLLGGLTFIAFRLYERHLQNAAQRFTAERRWARDGKRPRNSRTATQRSVPEHGISLDGTTLFRLVGTCLLGSLAVDAALGVSLRAFSTGSPLHQINTRDLARSPGFVPSVDTAAIIYQSALLRTLDITGAYGNLAIDSRPPRIGSASYPTLRTRGVGVDPAGVARTDFLNRLAPGMTIHSLGGVASGTNISAACRDEIDAWHWKRRRLSPARYEIRLTHGADSGEDPASVTLTMAYADAREMVLRTWLDDDDGPVLRQMFVFSQLHRKMDDPNDTEDEDEQAAHQQLVVIACEYTGHDASYLVRVPTDGSPISFLEDRGQGSALSPADVRPAAQAISGALGAGLTGAGDAAVLLAALFDGGHRGHDWGSDGSFERLLGDVLTDAAQGYYSIWRQRVEWWSVGSNKATADGWVRGRALRAGGGGWFWVGVTAALAALPSMALFRLVRTWDRTGERLLADIGSDDGLSEDEDQALFVERLAPRRNRPPPYSEKRS